MPAVYHVGTVNTRRRGHVSGRCVMQRIAAILAPETRWLLPVRRRRLMALAVLFATATMFLGGIGQRPADADVSGITASAFGYYTEVGINGEPATVRGYGQTIPPGTPESASPSVDCPITGTAGPVAVTDSDGARAIYGSRALFSGQWPQTATEPPPSGRLTVSCQGTTGATGSASSSASVIDVGPGPFIAGEVHSTCTATESGATGTTTILGGVLVTSTDADGKPVTRESIPIEPDVNYTRTGTINDVGDVYRIVLNEQIEDPVTGALTVNAAHLYLLGPTAEGEVVIASSTCGVAVTFATTTTGGLTTTTAGDTTTTTGATTTTIGATTTTMAPTTTTMGTTTTTTGAVTTTTTTTMATTTTTTRQPGDVPRNTAQCHNGGHAILGFKNPGDCVRFYAVRGGG